MIRASMKWMFLIIGTTIGAGYASGREIWQFFGYGSSLGILLFALFFMISCGVIMYISFKKQATDYMPVLDIIMGGRLVKIYDILIFIYLYTVTIVMIAGSGATGLEFNLPYWWGILFISLVLIGLFVKGINAFLALNQYIIPVLIGGLLMILLLFTIKQKVNLFPSLYEQENWVAAFPFTALNILPLVAVLGAVGNKVRTQGEIWIACIGSGVILGIITYMYNHSLIRIVDELPLYEIPLFAIIKGYSLPLLLIVTLILWISIFTTAAAGVLGIVSRLQRFISIALWKLVMIVLLTMIPLTAFGFTALIQYLYPIYGILNLYILVRLLLYPLWNKL